MKISEEDRNLTRSLLEETAPLMEAIKKDSPMTDHEIRIYCLEISRGGKDFIEGNPDIELAQKYYDFICATPSTQTE